MRKIYALMILTLVATFLFSGKSVYAFKDEIGAPVSEVWQATIDAFETTGTYKRNLAEGKIVTNWVYDEVKRSRGLFRGFTHRRVKRRYRFKIEIGKGEVATLLKLTVQVDEKSTSTSPSIPWKSVKLDSEDYILEQEHFFKILNQLSLNKQKVINPEKIPVAV